MKKEIKIDIDDKIYVVEITIDENLEIESVMVNEEFIDIKDINSIPNSFFVFEIYEALIPDCWRLLLEISELDGEQVDNWIE